MGLIGSLFKSAFDSWLENASDAELSEGYKTRRKEWTDTGFLALLFGAEGI